MAAMVEAISSRSHIHRFADPVVFLKMDIANTATLVKRLFRTTGYILSQYRSILTQPNNRSMRVFFGDAYMRHLCRHRHIKTIPISDLIPEDMFIKITLSGRSNSIISRTKKDVFILQSYLQTRMILALVRFYSPKRIFEFGTFTGVMTQNIFLNAGKGARMQSLDRKKRLSKEILKAAEQNTSLTFLNGDSHTYDFSNYFKNKDFIFIDAGHEYSDVKSDTENALKMLDTAGVILWDDYSDEYPGITKYLNELSTSLPLVHLENSTLVIYIKSQI